MKTFFAILKTVLMFTLKLLLLTLFAGSKLIEEFTKALNQVLQERLNQQS